MDDLKTRLTELVYKTVEKKCPIGAAIAFSGGLDSSLLAKVCKDLKKYVTLLTVGFENSSDLKCAETVAKELGLPLIIKKLEMKNIEKDLKKVASITNFTKLMEIEISSVFYYVFKLAKEKGIDIVLTANSMDAQFCGFDKFKQILKREGELGIKRMLVSEIEHAKQTEKQFKNIAGHFGIKMVSPFLDDEFIDFTLKIPIELKIKNSDDNLRKHILRQIASEIEVPKIAVNRSKKSMQYSSRIDSVIEKLARKHFTKTEAKQLGYLGVKEAYLKKFILI
jgi:asparagine synthase (glutamine-hydrolysing)